MQPKHPESTKKSQGARWLPFILGLALGALVILAVRFATYMPERVHYHANFAVYLNGQQYTFDKPVYYQPVSICSSDKGITIPQQRAHMHDNKGGVVHVHDHAVTWGQLFENLGWYVGPDFVETDDGTMYKASGDAKLHILLNDQDYTDLSPITDMVITDKARLLVSFGTIDDATLQQEYKTVANSAAHYDTSKDPASCASAESVTLRERLHHLL